MQLTTSRDNNNNYGLL